MQKKTADLKKYYREYRIAHPEYERNKSETRRKKYYAEKLAADPSWVPNHLRLAGLTQEQKAEHRRAQWRAADARRTPEKRRAKNAAKRAAHPEQVKAGMAVMHALASGRLVKLPCWVCGSEENIEGHHPSYDLPLDVVWLCRTHHKQLHREVV